MTPDLFDHMVKRTRLRLRTRDMVRAVLVRGERVSEIASRYHVSDKFIYRAIRKVLDQEYEAALTMVTVAVPLDRVDELKAIATEMTLNAIPESRYKSPAVDVDPPNLTSLPRVKAW